MNAITMLVMMALGFGIGAVTGHAYIGLAIGTFLGWRATRLSGDAMPKDIRKLITQQTNAYLTEVWAALPALQRIEAANADYAQANLDDIFKLHFPQPLLQYVSNEADLRYLGRMLIDRQVKPDIQIKAFKRANRTGLLGKKTTLAPQLLEHTGAIYARAGATPAMLQWGEQAANELGIAPDHVHKGYLDEIELQDSSPTQRLVAQETAIDSELDKIPTLPGMNQPTGHQDIARNTLYGEYRKGIARLRTRTA